MASKAYVASMTVAELTSELKQRGLSARGKKRDLQNRLEKALEEEELSDSGSESDGNDNQQLFQQAAAYAAYQTNPGMKNLTVSINRAEMVPSDPEIDPDPANQTQELIVSIQRSKRAVQLVEESSNDTGGQQIELNGEGRDKPILEQPSTAEDISVVGTAIGSSHEIGQVADDEPEGDQLPTSESDYSNQHAEEKEPEDVVHMQQPISLPHDFPPVDTNRASPSISEQVQFTNLSPGSTQLPPPLADDLQPSSSSSLPSSKPAQPLSASPTGDVQPSYYVQALPTEKELLSPLNSAPLTADISQPSSSDQPMELQPSSSMSPPLKLPPISSPPNTSLSESPVIGAPQPDTINQEPAVSELIPTARSLVSPTGNQDKIPQSSGTACLSESEQSSSQPCSLEGEEMEVSGETTEQAVTEETTRQESSSLAPSMSVESDDVVVGRVGNKEQEPDTSSVQERVAQMSSLSPQVDNKEASPSTPPPVDDTAPIAADSREPTSTSELPTTTEVESGASQSVQTEDQVVTELSTAPDPSTTSTSYVDSGKPSGEDESLLQGVVSSSGVEPAGIDADVVVPTVEDDDFSVFSAEAAEAQRLRSSAKETASSKRRLSSGDNSVSVGASNRLGRETYERDTSQEEQNGANSEASSNVPVQKRRRISTSPKRATHGEKKRRWGSTSGRVQLTPHAAISSDTLEDIIPEEVKAESSNQSTALDVVMSYSGDEGEKVVEEAVGRGEEEDVLDIGGREGLIDDEYEREWRMKEKEREEQRREAERARQELETRRRIEARLKAKQGGEITHEDEEKMDTQDNASPRSPSPARNPPTHILHVEHLTRPFTILQLKDLLEEDGKMVEGGFWTNRIKSHCIVVYCSIDSAIATRNRIHGMKWPSTNPKLLKADYLSTREVARVSEGQLELQETSPSPQPEVDDKPSPVPAVEQPRTASPNEPSDGQPVENTDNKKSDQKSTLVLDQLFHKTKATPPIYWLPLTEEQAKVKEDERKTIEDERQRLRAERVREREKERERSEREMRDRERKIREEREQRARDRYRRSSRSRSRSPRRRR